ncbi:MAG: hypothetical protein ACT4OJ_13425 [Bacteroidota bacterium]
MNRTEITSGVKKVIAQNSRFEESEINVNKDSLDRFISSSVKAVFARKLKKEFSRIRTTWLTNELYTNIKKVKQLIDYIEQVYTPTNV